MIEALFPSSSSFLPPFLSLITHMKTLLTAVATALVALTFTATAADARPSGPRKPGVSDTRSTGQRKFIGYNRAGDALYRVTYVAGYSRWTKRPIYKTRVEVVHTHKHQARSHQHGPVKKSPAKYSSRRR